MQILDNMEACVREALELRLPHHSYQIYVGSGLHPYLFTHIKAHFPASQYVIVTDTNVQPLYESLLAQARAELQAAVLVIPAGEIFKTRQLKKEVENFMLERNCDRKSCVIALGGGVVGDLAGYVAATYLRGVPLIMIPTTLLSMSDSSIGGKTAVDTQYGKNLLGAFHQPRVVYIDTEFLQTLSDEMLGAGMAEIIKCSLIRDANLFNLISLGNVSRLKTDKEFTLSVILASLKIKRDVVMQDERESKLRMILNFGHTVGHAIEAELDGVWNHGLCVSIGIVKALELGKHMGISKVDIDEVVTVLKRYALPVEIPRCLSTKRLLHAMYYDKKNSTGNGITYIVIDSIGTVHDPIQVPINDMSFVLAKRVYITGSIPAAVTVKSPGSKSITNRALLLSALGSGTCLLKHPLASEDTKVMMSCLQALGVCQVTVRSDEEWQVQGGSVTSQYRCAGMKELYVSNAGTAARFLSAAVMLIGGEETVIRGSARMNERPIQDLVQCLEAMDPGRITYLEKPGCTPLRIRGGGFKGGRLELNSKVSSQFVSAVLMAAPYAESPVTLILADVAEGEKPVSWPYIDMTIATMRRFGVNVDIISPREFHVPVGSYTNPAVFEVEPDASTASYDLALIALNGGTVTLEGIGSNSVQGDAHFCEVLRKMGCQIEQGDNYTKLTRDPGVDLQAVDVDMNNCTDTFMTAAVVMAMTPVGSISRIRGIANQNLKECNRIEATVSELRKLGIYSEETPDGLIIHGCKWPQMNTFACSKIIDTRGDHRLAMSFAVLSTAFHRFQIVIDDKQAVNKTHPGFWQALRDTYKLNLHAYDYTRPETKLLVVVGMRGVGKSTLTGSLGEEFGRVHVQLDDEVARKVGKSVPEYVAEQGLPAFRVEECAMLERMLNEHIGVLCTGGGVIESPKALVMLAAHFPVIYITTSIDNVKENITNDTKCLNRIKSRDLDELCARREPLYTQAADFFFYYHTRDRDLAIRSFRYFCSNLMSETMLPLPNDKSYFGCLVFPDYTALTEQETAAIKDISGGISAIEIRLDKLNDLSKMGIAVGVLRALCPSLPIMMTLRTKGQGGSYDGKNYFAVMREAAKYMPEYLDLEFEPDFEWKLQYRNLQEHIKSPTRIVLSRHYVSSNPNSYQERQMMLRCKADITKILFRSTEDQELTSFGLTFIKPTNTKPPRRELLITLGPQGAITRVSNSFFNPVAVMQASAPGQLTYNELRTLKQRLNLDFQVYNIYLFGNNIKQSPGLLVHNTLYQQDKLPLTYELYQTEDIHEVVGLLRAPGCLGASLTMPFKEVIMPFLDYMEPEAIDIGSVNTVYKYKGKLVGTNTDWLGVLLPLKSALQGRKAMTGVIVGAGGTCKSSLYALRRLGIPKIIIYNRSPERLVNVHWANTTTDLDSIGPVDILISTVPGSSGFTYPHLTKDTIVLDAAYSPRVTALMQQAQALGCAVFNGFDWFCGQFYYQYQHLTGRRALMEDVQEIIRTV